MLTVRPGKRVIAGRLPKLLRQGLPFICGKNLVSQARPVPVRSFFQAVIWAVFSARTTLFPRASRGRKYLPNGLKKYFYSFRSKRHVTSIWLPPPILSLKSDRHCNLPNPTALPSLLFITPVLMKKRKPSGHWKA